MQIFDEGQEKELHRIMSDFKGDGTALGNAVGALVFSRVYGWRVARLMYSINSYGKYQKLLGIDFKEWCPEVTDLSRKSMAYKFALKAGQFWELVRGKAKSEEFLEHKKELA